MKKILLILFLFFAICGCKAEKDGAMKIQDSNYAKKSYCVGRHIIDIPEEFRMFPILTGVFKNSGTRPQDPTFEVLVKDANLTKREFADEIQKRRRELKSSSSDTVDVLRMDKDLSEDTTIFRIQQIDDAYVSEVNLLRGGKLITVKLDSFHNQFESAEKALLSFVGAIREINNNSGYSSAQGFCLGTVVFVGDFNVERGGIAFNDSKGQRFDVDVDANAPAEEKTLLERMSGSGSLLNIFNVRPTVLRARERTIAGMRAQEWLGWAKLSEEKDAKTLKFALDTLPSGQGKKTPSISITFDTAQPLENGLRTKTVISDDEALRLWDDVMASIRPVNP
jgi:hypothetical protein